MRHNRLEEEPATRRRSDRMSSTKKGRREKRHPETTGKTSHGSGRKKILTLSSPEKSKLDIERAWAGLLSAEKTRVSAHGFPREPVQQGAIRYKALPKA